jgi:hypothetical protein
MEELNSILGQKMEEVAKEELEDGGEGKKE